MTDIASIPTELEPLLSHLEPEEAAAAVVAYNTLVGDEYSDEDLHNAFKFLYAGNIFEPVTTFLTEGDKKTADMVAERLLEHAKRPKELVVAHTFAGVHIERNHDPITAETHVQAAMNANADWGLAVDRAAWYKCDRGDAPGADRLWRQLYEPYDPQIVTVGSYVDDSDRKLNRNAPCWCESGRKFKQCHFGKPRQFSLEERVPWLAQKITCYVDRIGRSATQAMETLARSYLNDDEATDEAVEETIQAHPIINEVVAFDGDWLERFVEDRSALLPEDEAKLVQTWVGTKRSVFEITDVSEESVAAKDLDSGKAVSVTPNRFTAELNKGAVVCARAVSDGSGVQFIGSVFETKNQKDLLAALKEGSSEKFLSAASS